MFDDHGKIKYRGMFKGGEYEGKGKFEIHLMFNNYSPLEGNLYHPNGEIKF